jgi:hypothetical protein
VIECAATRREILIHFAAACAAVLLVFGTYHSLLGLGLLGFDAYPMILTARIQSFADLAGTFGEELMDGRFPLGSFYRPVTNLSIAVDSALWGLDPFGYHLTDLLVFAANGVLIFALVRKLFGGQSWPAGLVAMGLFALHPIQLETLPVPPRRADTLCLAFTLACLLSVALADERPARRAALRRAVTALFALLAVASKESGAIAAPLAFGLAYLRAPGPGAASRLRDAARRSLAAFAAVGVFVSCRTWVLGGLGGHADASLGQVFSFHRVFEPYLALLFVPQEYEPQGVRIALLSLAALLLAVWLLLRPPAGVELRRLRAGLQFALFWLLCLFAIHSLASKVDAWYASLFVAPYAVFLGIITQLGIGLARERRFAPAAAALVFALGLAANLVRYSPLFQPYPAWPQASRVAEDFLASFEARARAAEAGSTLRIRRFPIRIGRAPAPPGIRSAVILSDYSLQAWAELVIPEHPIRVRFARSAARTAAAPNDDALSVELYPRVIPLGADARWGTADKTPAGSP